MRLSIAIIAFVFSFVIPSYAETQSVTVRSGSSKTVSSFFVYNRVSCNATPFPKWSIKQPKHGTLTVKKTRRTIPKGRKCAGRAHNLVVVIYKSKAGYRGSDTGKVVFRYPKYRGEAVFAYYDIRYKISVK